jgi:hypothetical protein
MIEALVKTLIMKGITNNEKIVAEVDERFHPETPEEMEAYSEAIIYGKLGTLN